jgi:hypothetical protein
VPLAAWSTTFIMHSARLHACMLCRAGLAAEGAQCMRQQQQQCMLRAQA